MTRPSDLRILAETLFADLRAAGGGSDEAPDIGVSRDSYGAGETAALAVIERTARAHGLPCHRDAAANLVVILPGAARDLPAIACGSHLDSVPRGGNYDGAAGVVAGLLALISLRASGITPRRDIHLYALRGEESAAFGRAYIGSSALFGELGADDLALTHATTGQTLATRLADVGADLPRITRRETLLDPKSLACWLELHIEQGPVLLARGLPLAAVTGLRGNVRHRSVLCLGEAGHSGAVPRWLRHDAVFAVADLLARLDGHWQRLIAQGHDLVMTIGVIGTDPAEHAIARIPGKVAFSFEARSDSEATLDSVHALFLAECDRVAEERGVRFIPDRRLDTRPARLDPALVGRVRAAIRGLGLADEPIASGAGHDAAVFVQAGVPSAMIFVRNAHGSHNPAEAMTIDDFMLGAEALRQCLAEGAQ